MQLPVLGHVSQPKLYCLLRRCDDDIPPFNLNPPSCGWLYSKDGAGYVSPASAYQSSQAQDFSTSQFKTHIMKRSGTRQILYLQNDITRAYLLFGKQIGDRASDHHTNQIVASHIGHGSCINVRAIPQNSDAVSQCKQFFETMRNENDGSPLLA